MAASDIFKGHDPLENYTHYAVALQFNATTVGGVPSDPSVIAKWLTSRLELGDSALEELVAETVAARNEVLSIAEKVDAVMASADSPVSINGFKRNRDGVPCLEGRIIKSGLKEWMNIAYPGTSFPGKPKDIRKGLMRFAAERVFVPELFIPLSFEGDIVVEERIKHVSTPQGPRSAINRVEVVNEASIEFTVLVQDDVIPENAWSRIWSIGEQIGLGADRARSDGRFSLERWEKIS